MDQTPTTLELLVLGLVDHGIVTAYELKARAGISVGASHPLLNRLKKRGFLRSLQPEPGRGRQEFMLLAKGRAVLRSATAQLIRQARSNPPSDAESLLRIVALGILIGRPQDARDVLVIALQKRSESVARLRKPPTTVGEQYQWMISILQRQRRLADREALRGISRALLGTARRAPAMARRVH